MLEGDCVCVDGGGCGRMESKACLGWMWARSFALLADDWREMMAAESVDSEAKPCEDWPWHDGDQ